MDLQIFDVGHGACALLTCNDGSRMMIDCGHNGDTGWKPGTHLRSIGVRSIQKLCVTNLDEDHVSGIADLFQYATVERLVSNPTVPASLVRQLKTQDGRGPGIDLLCRLMDNFFTGGTGGYHAPFTGLTHEVFCNPYPVYTDENNLSAVNFLKCNGIGVMFTGDLECDGWLTMMAAKPDFKRALAETHILIAPHHGRESGCCEEALSLCRELHCVVISDKSHMYDTQKTRDFYRRFIKGCNFRGARRHILSTRNDGTIGITFGQGEWWSQQSAAA